MGVENVWRNHLKSLQFSFLPPSGWPVFKLVFCSSMADHQSLTDTTIVWDLFCCYLVAFFSIGEPRTFWIWKTTPCFEEEGNIDYKLKYWFRIKIVTYRFHQCLFYAGFSVAFITYFEEQFLEQMFFWHKCNTIIYLLHICDISIVSWRYIPNKCLMDLIHFIDFFPGELSSSTSIATQTSPSPWR